MSSNQRTMCYEPADEGRVCGGDAIAPHPDPAIGYLRGLCRRHLALTEAEIAEAERWRIIEWAASR